MADEFAVVVLDAPTAAGNQDFTSPNISAFRGAVVFASGDYLDEDGAANLSLALFSEDNASNTSHGWLGTFYRAGSTGASFARHLSRGSSGGAGIIRILDPATNGGNWATGDVSDLSNGFRVNWTDVTGLSSGARKVKLIAILFGGDTVIRAGFINENQSFMSSDGTLEHVLAFAKRGGYNQTLADFSATLGGAVDGSPIVQASAGVLWPSAADPVTCGSVASEVDYNAFVTSGLAGIDGDEILTMSTAGFTRTGNADSPFWLGFDYADDRHGLIALEEFTGSESGVVLLSGLGAQPELVIGCFVGATSTDALVTGAASEVLGFFVAHADGVHSISVAIEEGIDPDSVATAAFQRYKADEWNVIDSAGGTAFRATDVELVQGGVQLDIQTARAGRLFLWGVSIVDPITPDPVALGIAAATPAVLTENRQTPSPVALGLAAPTPQVVLPRLPDPVELAFVLPAPSVIAPLPPPPVDPAAPELGEAYGQALRDLLPRGLAWTRLETTVLGKLLRALAETCEALERRALELLREADPRLALELLAEWELLLRTRIDCPDLGASLIERRAAVFARLTTPGGQNRYHYAQVAQALGYDVDVEDFEELSPFQVEVDTVETPLYGDEWRFVVIVHAPEITPTYFRVGLSQAGDPLVTATNARLECELDRRKPAHVLFLYQYDRPFEGYAPWNVHAPDPIPLGLSIGAPAVVL